MVKKIVDKDARNENSNDQMGLCKKSNECGGAVTEVSIETSEVSRVLYHMCVEARKEPVEPAQGDKGKVIVIAGPTACGKSDFGLMLSKTTGGEIVSGDSMQVYRGLDIGTAKATIEERFQVPHHLIDIRDVVESFTVVDFYEAATKAIQSILDRKAVPIVVGGSGFYLHALVYGPPSGPPPVPHIRAQLEAEMEQLGAEVLYQRLVQMDPEYAEGITCHDRHKIVRGLEIITITGQKVSSLPWKGRSPPQKFDFRCWFLTRPKEALYARIERRCLRMLEAGFIEEVERMEKLGLRSNTAASQAIGYRQALAYLASQRTPQERELFIKEFMQASRHYAKRQHTWFRREPLYRWLDVDMLDFENAVEIVLKDYERIL